MKKGIQRKHPSYINIKVSNLFSIKWNCFLMFAESLKDLVRFLRRDDTTCEIRRQLGYSEVLQNVCSFLCYFFKLTNSYNNSLKLWKLRLLFNENSSKLKVSTCCPSKRIIKQSALKFYNVHVSQYASQYLASIPVDTWPIQGVLLVEYRSTVSGISVV